MVRFAAVLFPQISTNISIILSGFDFIDHSGYPSNPGDLDMACNIYVKYLFLFARCLERICEPFLVAGSGGAVLLDVALPNPFFAVQAAITCYLSVHSHRAYFPADCSAVFHWERIGKMSDARLP